MRRPSHISLLSTTTLPATMLVAIVLIMLAPHMNAQRIGSSSPRFASGFNHPRHFRNSFYPLALSDPFYSDYLSSTGYPVASQPPVIVMLSPSAPARVADRFPPPAQPLMIELQGDRYVRVNDSETSGAEMIEPERVGQVQVDQVQVAPSAGRRPSGAAVAPAAARELARAVLVFRDGHREEVSEYAIADGNLYSRADYYTDGSWNRKIALAALNLPETIETNRSRGVRFQLPTAPNEVIVSP